MATLAPYGIITPEQRMASVKGYSGAINRGIGAVVQGAQDYTQYVDTAAKRSRLIDEVVGLDPKLSAKRVEMEKMTPDELVGKAYMLKQIKDKVSNIQTKYADDMDENGQKQTYLPPSLDVFFGMPVEKLDDVLATLDNTDKTYGSKYDERLTKNMMSLIEGDEDVASARSKLNNIYGKKTTKQIDEYLAALELNQKRKNAIEKARLTGSKAGSNQRLQAYIATLRGIDSLDGNTKSKDDLIKEKQKNTKEWIIIGAKLKSNPETLLGSKEFDANEEMKNKFYLEPDAAKRYQILDDFNGQILAGYGENDKTLTSAIEERVNKINTLSTTVGSLAKEYKIPIEKPKPKGIIPNSIGMAPTAATGNPSSAMLERAIKEKEAGLKIVNKKVPPPTATGF